MGADDFVQRYWTLQVTPSISCNKYFIAPYPGAQGPWVQEARQKQARLRQLEQTAQSCGLAVQTGSFVRARCGKASPEDLEHVLNLALATGVDSGRLQHWADQNLGVDCTGFAVAYFASLGLMSLDAHSTGASCSVFYTSAIHSQHRGHAIIWNLPDVQPNDVILWMYSNGHESRRPGHISIVVGKTGHALHCAESSGEPDGQHHSGPRLRTRLWAPEMGTGPHRCLRMDQGAIVVRPFGNTPRTAPAPIVPTLSHS